MNESIIRLCFGVFVQEEKQQLDQKLRKTEEDLTRQLNYTQQVSHIQDSSPSELIIIYFIYFIYAPDPVWEKQRVGQTAMWMDVTIDLSVQQTHARPHRWAWTSSRGNPTAISWHAISVLNSSSINHIYWLCLFFCLYIYILVFFLLYFFYFIILFFI